MTQQFLIHVIPTYVLNAHIVWLHYRDELAVNH
jgi:hypothetical protein